MQTEGKRSQIGDAAFAGPVVEDEELGRIELVAGGKAVCSDGSEDKKRSEKHDKRRGETLVIANPREDATKCGWLGVRTERRKALGLRVHK